MYVIYYYIESDVEKTLELVDGRLIQFEATEMKSFLRLQRATM